MMDDFSITDARLERALVELMYVNRYLGGFRAVRRELEPEIRQRIGASMTLLDLGTGIADIPERLVVWGDRLGVRLSVTALDANPATVDYARRSLDARMKPRLRDRIEVQVGDALKLSYSSGAFDAVTASAFLHHFDDDRAVDVLREMRRVSAAGLIVNDLHRHRAAHAGIKTIAALMPVSEMFGHDGPASVRRAFTPAELHSLAERAGLSGVRVRRRWAYRLVLSTMTADEV